jgi:D-3-phosphoglycerate dehydrogenase
VARVSRAIGMRVVAFDPVLDDAAFAEQGVARAATLDELLPQCDWLSLHAPLNDHTRGMIGARSLGLMKRGARLVNCARGALVDEAALLEALRSGQLAGAALDVFAKEPCTDSPLFGLENVVATPHLGASTEEAQLGVALDAARRLLGYLQTGDPTGAFNAKALQANA